MKNKLTISIVAYNNIEEVIKLVDCIEKYTSVTISKRIYIVDNSDKADTSTRTCSFLSQRGFEDVEYIKSEKNVGFGKGHNKVLWKIESEYHAIVNPDVEIYEDVFSKIVSYMDENDDIGMVIPCIIDETGERQQVYREEVTIIDMFIRMFCKRIFPNRVAKHTLQDKDYSKPFQVPFGQGSFLVIRTQLFRQLDGFDERFFMYMEDADLCKRLNNSSKLMYYPEANVIHKWEKGSHKSLALFKHHVSSMIKYFRKWGIKLY